jgi:hypothetical protein
MSRRISINERVVAAWADWYAKRLDRINAGSQEDYTGYEIELFNAIRAAQKRPARQKRLPEISHKSRKPSKRVVGRPCGNCERCLQGDSRHCSDWRYPTRKPSKAEKREARAAIREKVFARAAETNDDPTDHYQRCEGPKHHNPEKGGRCTAEASELAHVFGRGKGRLPESERTCLALCHWCHKRETMNAPSGAAWWVFFAALFTRLGWTFEATEAQKRAHFESTRSKLGAGLKER